MYISSNPFSKPAYSLITVNFRSLSALGRMLRSLPEEFCVKSEIIIVNNDHTEQQLLERMVCRFGSVRLLASPSNLGFARACNYGAMEARADILLFLNPDTSFSQGFFEEWLHDLQKGERSIVAPLLLQNGREEAWSIGRSVSPLSIILCNLIPSASFWAYTAKQSLGFMSGAALAMRKDVFQYLGGFSEMYFLYYEDVDLCRRAKESGIQLKQKDQMIFIHHGGVSHKNEKENQKQHYFRSQEQYLTRYYGVYWAALFHALRVIRFPFLFHI